MWSAAVGASIGAEQLAFIHGDVAIGDISFLRIRQKSHERRPAMGHIHGIYSSQDPYLR